MKRIERLVLGLKKKEIRDPIRRKMRQFEALGRKGNDDLFLELCFCILTANFQAGRAIRIQEEIGRGFIDLPEIRLAKRLKELGYRFPNTRANYIVSARKYRKDLRKVISSETDERELRDFLAKNVKGLGMKEASHFLRNIGFKNVAIIDFHILDILEEYKVIEKSKTLTRKGYLEVEKILEKVAKNTGLSLAELDLYLWYEETGEVLK